MSERSEGRVSTGAAVGGRYEERGDVGYRRSLSNSQIQMISIGGAVGVGLFLGLGERLKEAGPALVLSYLAVSALVYLMMRALGEMVFYRPSTGAFVSYAREFVGPRFAHLTGWVYVTLGSLAGITEIAAISVYARYWFPDAPGWVPAVLALCVIVGSNLLAARAFGVIEFLASSVKVAAILLFLVAGVLAVVFGFGAEAGVANLWEGAGFFAHGLTSVFAVMPAVVFSFSAIEVVGISAGEAREPAATMPRAIRNVVVRIGVFYLGSIVVLCALLPTDRYSGAESPFVTALSSLGVPYLDGIMNLVVVTAAVSGVNATLYGTVRTLRNLAANGQAPGVTVWINRRGVPVGALVTIGGCYLIGALLIFFAGAGPVFEVALSSCAVCILIGWVSIFVSHLRFRRQVVLGLIPAPSFRMPGSPYTNWICLAALGAVFAHMVFDFSNEHWYFSLIAALLLLGGHTVSYEVSRRRTARRGLPDVRPLGERG